jgi:hypothetical protein
MFISGVNDTRDKLLTPPINFSAFSGINDTGDKFFGGGRDTVD